MSRLTWSPDICGCTFEINSDFDLKKVEKKCPMHTHLQDKVCFTTVIDRDKKINLMPKNKNETDEEYQNRRWLAKDEAINGSKGKPKKNK